MNVYPDGYRVGPFRVVADKGKAVVWVRGPRGNAFISRDYLAELAGQELPGQEQLPL